MQELYNTDSHSEVVAIESVIKLTLTTVLTIYDSAPTPNCQHKLEDQHKDESEQKSPCESTSPLLELPKDLKMCIFDYLSPIDSTCLGLASRHLYPTYRYRFPNPLPLDHLGEGQLALEWKDRVYEREQKPRIPFCWKCGPCRCELQRHIKDFVEPDALLKIIKSFLRRMGLPHQCKEGKCALDGMGWPPSTKRPCRCWH